LRPACFAISWHWLRSCIRSSRGKPGHQSADAHAPIQKLEARLGTKLADRGGNTYVELTAAGSASGKRVTVHRIGMKQER
jgi:hypothetical protein